MKKVLRTRNANVALALPVAANTPADAVVAIGTDGLQGIALTPRATAATIAAGTAAPGLADGQASVELPGVNTVLQLAVAGTAAVGKKVYRAADGSYTFTATDNVLIGYWVGEAGNNLTGPVAVRPW